MNIHAHAGNTCRGGLRLITIPIASVEYHGLLPPETDYLIATCVSRQLASMLEDAFVAPVLAYSTATEHEGVGFTLGAYPTAFATFIEGILVSASRWANAVAALAFHGGAFHALYAAAREARRRTGKRVTVENFWSHIAEILHDRYGIEPYPIHADPVEASLLLVCGYRQGIRETGLEEALSEARRRAGLLRRLPQPWIGEDCTSCLYPDRPVPASRELGRQLLDEAIDRLSGRLNA